MSMCGHPERRAGFSLIELVAVLAILSALSITALPALQRIEDSRRSALAGEIERRLTMARASAMATGMAHGLRIDAQAGEILSVRIEGAGSAPTAARGPTGDPAPAFEIASAFPGAAIGSVANGDGADQRDTIWFAYDGTPHLREPDGTFVSEFTEDALIEIAGGRTVRVRRSTGLIEQDPG